MRKLIVCVCLICFFITSNAQDSKNLRFGLAFSPQLSWLSSDNSLIESEGIRVGFNYGLLVDYFFENNYALSTGFLSSHYGGGLTGRLYADSTTAISEKYKLQYVEIPLSFKLQTNEIGYITYYGQIGLMPALRIRARASYDQPYLGQEIDNENVIKKDNPADIQSNLLNLSLNVGAGIQYGISGNMAIIGGIYFNNGFTSVLDDGDDERTYLRSLQLRTGVIF